MNEPPKYMWVTLCFSDCRYAIWPMLLLDKYVRSQFSSYRKSTEVKETTYLIAYNRLRLISSG